MTHNKKLNWFDILMGIGVMLMIALGIYLASRLNNAQAAPLNIPTMDYGYEVEEDYPEIDTVIGTPIAMYPDGVYSFAFEEGMWLIEYADYDAFDMDRLAEEDEAYQYYDYIIIECTEETFFDYLAWYAHLNDSISDAEYESNHGYYIREVITDVPGGKNYRYYLQKM